MNQISVKFDKKTEAVLRQKAQEKEMRLSEYLRRLIEIGLRVEEASSSKSSEDKLNYPKISELGELLKLWEKTLAWTLESRLLLRILVPQVLEKEEEKQKQLVTTTRTKAEKYVAGLLNNEVDTE